jgi:hypothetical protein
MPSTNRGGAVLGYDLPLLSKFSLVLWRFFPFSILVALIWAFSDKFREAEGSHVGALKGALADAQKSISEASG